MNKTLILLSFSIFLLATACQKSTEEANKELYNQVMDVHDEMMPKMGAFHTMRTAFKGKLAMADSLGLDSLKLQANLALVDSADNAMRVWMREFNPDDYEGEELTEYLKSELIKVNDMKALMTRALALQEGNK